MDNDERSKASANPLAEQMGASDALPLARMVNQGVSAAGVVSSEQTGTAPVVRERVGAGYIWLLILALLGLFIALIAPVGISLALRVQEIAPDNVEFLGYVIGIGSVAAAIANPLIGMASDRTRSRFGRRRPYAIVGAIIGVGALALLAVAPNIPALIAAWCLTQIAFSATQTALLLSQADRLPEEQRGKVAGLSGFAQMIASVLGIAIASAFIGNTFLVFLVPGAIGLTFILLFVLFVKEPDSRNTHFQEPMGFRRVLAGMVFNPKHHTDFAWNWLGRLLFNFGVTFSTTFTTVFFASRLSEGGLVADIGGLIAILGLVGVIGTAGGALLGGVLSDKLNRRRIFVMLAGAAYTVGAVTMAFGGNNLILLAGGSFITAIGLGVFSAVDQAIVLDILPDRDTQAGRFIGINQYAITFAQAIAPIAAVPLLLVGVEGADRNYGLLFIVAAICTLLGGLIILAKVRGSR